MYIISTLTGTVTLNSCTRHRQILFVTNKTRPGPSPIDRCINGQWTAKQWGEVHKVYL